MGTMVYSQPKHPTKQGPRHFCGKDEIDKQKASYNEKPSEHPNRLACNNMSVGFFIIFSNKYNKDIFGRNYKVVKYFNHSNQP